MRKLFSNTAAWLQRVYQRKTQRSLVKTLQKSFKKHKKNLIFLFATFGTYLTYVFSKMFFFSKQGVFIGHPNAWSDWALHISLTNIFATKPISEWFLYHPYYANGKLTYGFLSHLITGMFMRIGIRIDTAFFIVSLLLTIGFLLGIYTLYYQLSRSKTVTFLGIFLVFTSSGLGIFRFIRTLALEQLLHPIKDYTSYIEYKWLAGNIPSALLIPQRAFFIGVTIGLWVLNIFWYALQLQKKSEQQIRKKLFITAGVLAGLLPIAHMHSFIAVVVITGTICAFRWKEHRRLIYFVSPAAILSSILFFTFVHGGIEISPFMTVSIGWTAPESFTAWVTLWLKVWGVFIPSVLFAAWYFRKEKQYQSNLPFYIGFLAIFILANIIIFQPTEWDNTKLFSWVYIGFAVLVAQLLVTLWQKQKLRLVALGIGILLSLSGTVELLRLANFTSNTYILNTADELVIAQEIKEHTETNAVFLTATAHNHPVAVWASRPIFLGYLGWVRNFGFEHRPRELQLIEIYSGAPTALSHIRDNKISYIYVGPKEHSTLTINQYFLQQFPVAFQNGNTTVFDTRSLWQ